MSKLKQLVGTPVKHAAEEKEEQRQQPSSSSSPGNNSSYDSHVTQYMCSYDNLFLFLLADTPDVVDEGSVRAYSSENTHATCAFQ